MTLSTWGILIISIIIYFLFGQFGAAGNYSLGRTPNGREYSSWYETHFLIKRKGIIKWIYFKPKHFERYTLFEVISFFFSYLQMVALIALTVLVCVGILSVRVLLTANGVLLLSMLLLYIVVAAINTVGCWKDERKRFYLESGERVVDKVIEAPLKNGKPQKGRGLLKDSWGRPITMDNPFFTIYNLQQSYWRELVLYKKDGEERLEEIHQRYIEYFKNIERLVVVEEKEEYLLVLKYKEE